MSASKSISQFATTRALESRVLFRNVTKIEPTKVEILRMTKVMWKNRPFALLLLGIIFFIFALTIFIFSFPSKTIAIDNAPAAVLVAEAALSVQQELHVANNGLILVRGAKIIGIDGTTLTIISSWGKANFTWHVQTNESSYARHDFGTRFVASDGQRISLSDIQVGNTVTITGTLSPDEKMPTLIGGIVRIVK